MFFKEKNILFEYIVVTTKHISLNVQHFIIYLSARRLDMENWIMEVTAFWWWHFLWLNLYHWPML